MFLLFPVEHRVTHFCILLYPLFATFIRPIVSFLFFQAVILGRPSRMEKGEEEGGRIVIWAQKLVLHVYAQCFDAFCWSELDHLNNFLLYLESGHVHDLWNGGVNDLFTDPRENERNGKPFVLEPCRFGAACWRPLCAYVHAVKLARRWAEVWGPLAEQKERSEVVKASSQEHISECIVVQGSEPIAEQSSECLARAASRG